MCLPASSAFELPRADRVVSLVGRFSTSFPAAVSRRSALVWLLIWILPGLAMGQSARPDVAGVIEEGVAARLADDPVTAIERFEAVLAVEPDNADVHLQLALAWRSRGDLARSATHIERGLSLAPLHGDLRVERARLAMWDAREAAALAEVDAVLHDYPDHAEALNLRVQLRLRSTDAEGASSDLARLRELEPRSPAVRLLAADAAWLLEDGDVARDEVLAAWTLAEGDRSFLERCCDRFRRYRRNAVELAAGASRFKRLPLSNWREQRLQISRRGDGRNDYWLRLERMERFDERDYEIVVGGSRVFSDVAWGWMEFGGVPDAAFRPDWQWAAGGEWGPSGGVDAVGRPTWTGRLSVAEYDSGTVASGTVGTRYWWTERTALSASVNLTRDEESDYDAGWQVRLDHRLASAWRFHVGYADVADTISGNTVSTQSWFGGLAVCITPQWELFLDVGRDDRQRSYVRESVSGGIRLRW